MFKLIHDILTTKTLSKCTWFWILIICQYHIPLRIEQHFQHTTGNSCWIKNKANCCTHLYILQLILLSCLALSLFLLSLFFFLVSFLLLSFLLLFLPYCNDCSDCLVDCYCVCLDNLLLLGFSFFLFPLLNLLFVLFFVSLFLLFLRLRVHKRSTVKKSHRKLFLLLHCCIFVVFWNFSLLLVSLYLLIFLLLC